MQAILQPAFLLTWSLKAAADVVKRASLPLVVARTNGPMVRSRNVRREENIGTLPSSTLPRFHKFADMN